MTALDARCVRAVWVGVYEPTGENIVICAGGRGAAFRCRTVARMPLEQRWDAESVLGISATPRIPDPRVPGRGGIPTAKQARVFDAIRGEHGAADDDDDSDSDDDDGDEGQDPPDGPRGARERCDDGAAQSGGTFSGP